MNDTATKAALRMSTCLQEYIQNHPAFRSKPIGAPGSDMRNLQQLAIGLEDAAKRAIADFDDAYSWTQTERDLKRQARDRATNGGTS